MRLGANYCIFSNFKVKIAIYLEKWLKKTQKIPSTSTEDVHIFKSQNGQVQ